MSAKCNKHGCPAHDQFHESGCMHGWKKNKTCEVLNGTIDPDKNKTNPEEWGEEVEPIDKIPKVS